jgi:ferredoxin
VFILTWRERHRHIRGGAVTHKCLRVLVDRTRCVSSGNCADIEPLVFAQEDAGGVVVLLSEYPDRSLYETVQQAAALCPSQAITCKEVEPPLKADATDRAALVEDTAGCKNL